MTTASADENLSLDERKAALRKANSAIRARAAKAMPDSPARLARHADALKASLLPAEGLIVAGYWPIRSEIDPIPLLAALAGRGCRTALPATPEPGKPLVFHHWQPGDPLVGGLYGTSEPQADAPRCQPDCLLVPMLAFDDGFFRLGYGGGFYDRSLAAIRVDKPTVRAVGIAYDDQKVAAVPVGPHDARLDAVLTPSGVILPTGDNT
ncbi:MAG: 5-formyltetrahydrofolate cyclo-ligase [Candidatus Puniceispirillales bacterium]